MADMVTSSGKILRQLTICVPPDLADKTKQLKINRSAIAREAFEREVQRLEQKAKAGGGTNG